MNCKDCPNLVKTESAESVGHWDLHCTKHNIDHCPISEANLKYLVCVEDERRRSDGTIHRC